MDIQKILEKVKNGEVSVKEAREYLRREPFEEMGFAKLDTHRKLRSGFAEVIFCSGKTDSHLLNIFGRIYEHEGEVFGTRASEDQFKFIKMEYPQVTYDPVSRILRLKMK